MRLCRPPPSPDHGRVACSSVGDDVSITNCRYTCDDGYVTPKTDRHLENQDWDCYSDPGTSRPPKCISKRNFYSIWPKKRREKTLKCNVFKRYPDVVRTEFEVPIPLDSSQCSGLNLTVPDFDEVQLPLPKFQTPPVNSAVYVTCDLNIIQAAAVINGSHIPVVYKRFCVAKNNETDAKFNCNYDIQINRKKRTQFFIDYIFKTFVHFCKIMF